MYKKVTLANGIRFVTNQMKGMESVALGIWIKSGSRNENKKLCGTSHFLEHMLFKGTPSVSCRKLKEEMEGRGGSINAFTSEEITCFMAKVSGAHLKKAIELLSDMVANASLQEKDIEKERQVIIEEIKMYEDLPNHFVHDMLADIMWRDHSLGLPIAGTIESVNSITRDGLVEYKKLNYTPENMAFVLCGNLDHVLHKKDIIAIFNKKAVGRGVYLDKDFINKQTKPAIKILNKETAQSHMCMGFHSFGRDHKDKYVLNLLHIILGANMSSRLFETIREQKGLCYEIGTEVKKYRETGIFMVTAGIEHLKVQETISVILKELKKIKKTLVSRDELKRAKEFFKIQLLMALEDTVDHMLWLGDRVITTNKLPDKKEVIKGMDRVNPDDIRRVANVIFNNSKLNLAIIGALNDAEQKKIERTIES